MLRSLLKNGRALLARMARNRWAFRMIGVVLFVLILLRVDLREALRTLASVDPLFILLSLAIQGVAIVVSALRWQLIMRRLEIRISFGRTFVHQMIGTSAALVTPGQLGEFVKVLYHRRRGYPVAESFLSVVIDRAFDLLMLLLFGFISLGILFGIPQNLTIALAAAATLAAVAAFLYLRNRQASSQWFANILRRMSPKAYKETVQEDALRLAGRIGEFNPGILTVVGLLTVANYILLLFRVYAVVLSLHLTVPVGYFVLVVPLLRLSGLIPISVLGIGTRDLTSIALFGLAGVPETSALLISTIGLFTILVQAFVGLLFWWRFPLELEGEGEPSLQTIASQD